MQVKSVSQLSSVNNDDSFKNQIDVLSSNQSYVEVSIKKSGDSGEFDSYKCNFSQFLEWIIANVTNAEGNFDNKLKAFADSISAEINNNFVHKTISGVYEQWGSNPEVIYGQKHFEDQLSAKNGKINKLSALTSDTSSLSCSKCNVNNTINAKNVYVSNELYTYKLEATYSPADLTAKAAMWN